MEIVKVALADLKAPEKNIRIHTKKQINEFVRSIQMFGQIRPVVIDEENRILAGNGLVEALLQAGEVSADAYRMSNLTEHQKKKLMIADNKIFSLGLDNLEVLNAFLDELQDDLDIPGFDEEILQAMVATAEEVTETLSTYGILDETEIQHLKDNGVKKEEQMMAGTTSPPFQSDQSGTIPQTKAIPQATDNDTAPRQDQSTDKRQVPSETRRSVICPKCGETIWL